MYRDAQIVAGSDFYYESLLCNFTKLETQIYLSQI